MHVVDLGLRRLIGRADGSGEVVNRPSVDVQQLGLARDRRLMVTLGHRFVLSNPDLVSAPSKKSFSSVS